MKKYITENNDTMPLCCVQDDIYFDYLTGEVITDKNVIKFINNGLKYKTMEAKEIDLKIIEIFEEIYCDEYIVENPSNPCQPFKLFKSKKKNLVAYNYIINGYSNYLNINRQPLNDFERTNLTNLLMKGKFKQEVIWE